MQPVDEKPTQKKCRVLIPNDVSAQEDSSSKINVILYSIYQHIL